MKIRVLPMILVFSAAGASADCDHPAAPVLPQEGQIRALQDALIQDQHPKWLDGLFYIESEKIKKDTSDPSLAQFQAGSLNLPVASQMKVSQIYYTAIGQGYPSISSYSQQSRYLQSVAGTLSVPEKLQLLSYLGSALALDYNYNQRQGTENRDLNQLFLNLKNGGTQGGICGDIHEYLRQLATALGFQDAGIYSGLWQQDPKNAGSAAGHVVSYFKDPASGDYYVQNYSTLVNTGKRDLHEATEVGLRTLGPLTGVSYLESPNGTIHAFVPNTALWMKNALQDQAAFSSDNSAVMNISASQNEQTVGLQWRPFKDRQVKAFYVHSTVQAEEGPYSFDAVGVAGQADFSKKLVDSKINEFGAAISGFVCGEQLSAPVLGASGDFVREQRMSGCLNGDVKGYARINRTTGKLEIQTTVLDSQVPPFRNGNSLTTGFYTQMSAGVEHELKNAPVKVGIQRNWEVVPAFVGGFADRPQTSNDQISVYYDTSRGADDPKTYLKIGTDVYVMEGLEKRSAIAVKQAIEASVDKGRLGTFTVGMDLVKYVSNRSGDPFYDQPASANIRFNWDKILNKKTHVGAQLSYHRGSSNFPFATIGEVLPNLEPEHGLTGMVYLHEKW